MAIPQHILGKYGEQIASDYLTSLGYQIIDRNWHCSLGEIDIVAEFEDSLVFIEVKTRRGRGFGHPFEAITEVKRARMKRLAGAWLAAAHRSVENIRMDAIAVLVETGRVRVEHQRQVS